ncbi:Asp-tRNA(Asn)/Glu-tRNA(Gln) amidotransferase subunit GatA [Mycoplasmoides pirum]|uniref:Asp-tRNA(Asn)/Glu-tRNA(Gln) amidotransferase subunit GatA n=1 Tax=Mycoplasmoides pirum TaxID=2122 RepID=UPI000485F832|nr:Asp-tRNA(Asn)/Glu-tRNA(Gln) amidotransferase subunit GatA [Mycoplasmoides pirum]
MRSKIIDLHQQLKSQNISATKLIKKTIRKISKFKKTNFLINTNIVESTRLSKHLDKSENFSKSFLACIPYVLKDNISTKDIITTGGSKFLENYIPPYDATVYKLLKKNNAILVGKANLDEFGLGGTGSFSAYGIVSHPFNKKHIAGGSSSGSAVAVASGVVPFSIGTDTGDSIRRPASFCGVVGYKPTYGLISRHGVYPYAPSLDHVGVFANTIVDVALVADAIIAYDTNDFSSQKFNKNLFVSLNEPISDFTIGYPANIEIYMDENILTAWNKLKSLLLTNNIKLVPLGINLELLNAINPIYKIISYSEAVSCYSSFTGIPFGKHLEGNNFEEIAEKSRTLLFGDQLKYRFTIGSFALKKENFDKYYLKSKLVRTKLVNHFNDDFLKKVDVVMSIGSSCLAPLIKDVVENKKPTSNLIDDFLQISNFAGAPSITIPFAKDDKNLFLGVNLTAAQFKDDLLLKIALVIENIINTKGVINV